MSEDTLSSKDPGMPQVFLASPSQVRDKLTEMIRRDLLGPAGGPEEELPQEEDHVYGRYLVGMLAPKNAIIEPGEMDDLVQDHG